MKKVDPLIAITVISVVVTILLSMYILYSINTAAETVKRNGGLKKILTPYWEGEKK